MSDTESVDIEFDIEETSLLSHAIPNFYQTTTVNLFIMALTQVITTWTNGSAVEITCPVLGRDVVIPGVHAVDLSRTVGWLAFSDVLVLRKANTQDPIAALRAINTQLERSHNGHHTYHLLADLLGDPDITLQLHPLRKDELLLNYFGQMEETSGVTNWLQEAPESPGQHQNPQEKPFNKLYIQAGIYKKQLLFSWHYNSRLYRADTINKLAQSFKQILEALITIYRTQNNNEAFSDEEQ